jgi:DNA helicase HerA-like ATPase
MREICTSGSVGASGEQFPGAIRPAVVDLYELKLTERRRFVKLFLESLIRLPRNIWRPTLVILDEAHLYCPERGSGKAESTEAAISLMSWDASGTTPA